MRLEVAAAAGDKFHPSAKRSDRAGVARPQCRRSRATPTRSRVTLRSEVQHGLQQAGLAGDRAGRISSGASANGATWVIRGRRSRSPSCCSSTARAPQPRLGPAVAGLGRDAGDLRADQLDAVVVEFLAKPQARHFALEEAHRHDARRISDGADRFGQRRRRARDLDADVGAASAGPCP